MKKTLLSGNEAIARGAWEAGAAVGTGYPGTPSTEILENLVTYADVSCEWSVNEKVALEVGLGAAFAGSRTLVTMKHVGVNVAADPLFTAAYTGVKAGLVLVSADDPDMHSSQNEQDNRHYAISAKLPALEPADSQEAKDFTMAAFGLSEEFDTPVMLRTTTRLSHSKSAVTTGERTASPVKPGFERNAKKYVMIPAYARLRHVVVEERMRRLEAYAETTPLNRVEEGSGKIAFITSGIPYTYVKEAFPEAPVLKLGMVHPLPRKMIEQFCKAHATVHVIEELDPVIETQLLAWGLKVSGKELLSNRGEYDPLLLREKIAGEKRAGVPDAGITIPPRPPSLCPGCPHQLVFKTLNQLGVTVSGDIGCYTLGVLPPYSAMDTTIDMGASITVAQGIEIATAGKERAVAVIGDSTFAHSGITGLINAAYNKRNTLIIVLDNGTTAMTGMQPNPFSGETINGEATFSLDYAALATAVGIAPDCFREVSAYKQDEIVTGIKALLDKNRLALLVVKGTCVIFKRRQAKKQQEASGG